MAYRARFQANVVQSTYRNFVMQDVATPDPLNPKMVEDNMNMNSYVVLLSAGFEKRRGSNRLQGFYGAEAMFGFTGLKRNYTYGNNYSSATPTPTSTTDFNSGASSMVSSRITETSSGNSILGGVRGFGGVEYFFAPKISLGGEIGYTIGISTNGKGYTTRETLHTGTGSAVTVTADNYNNAGLRSMGISLDNVNAGINLHFYF